MILNPYEVSFVLVVLFILSVNAFIFWLLVKRIEKIIERNDSSSLEMNAFNSNMVRRLKLLEAELGLEYRVGGVYLKNIKESK